MTGKRSIGRRHVDSRLCKWSYSAIVVQLSPSYTATPSAPEKCLHKTGDLFRGGLIFLCEVYVMMQSVLKKRPLMRTMIAYGFVNVTADALEQNLISKKKVYDSLKTVRVTLVGTFLVAPLVFNWIRLTERLLPSKKVPAVLIKVLCDQFLFAPVAITTFYIGTNILERQKDLLAEWKRKFFPTWTV
ncbi:hypothetical protein CHS0354_017216 [Potamilus streckersoni]|uniref:Mpv17-like protein n=1 Tax=Potamilus streckersoni TaxID=2493646 RepID=A0AAE0VM03_9BIVA|nr:hypothetical protein CHS0354_017216 [Potamilus streckersoni]